MNGIHTYPEMNETIKDLLADSKEPMDRYIHCRLVELENENETLKQKLEEAVQGKREEENKLREEEEEV